MEMMRSLFHDWQARSITSVLHDKSGDYANNSKALAGFDQPAQWAGRQRLSP